MSGKRVQVTFIVNSEWNEFHNIEVQPPLQITQNLKTCCDWQLSKIILCRLFNNLFKLMSKLIRYCSKNRSRQGANARKTRSVKKEGNVDKNSRSFEFKSSGRIFRAQTKERKEKKSHCWSLYQLWDFVIGILGSKTTKSEHYVNQRRWSQVQRYFFGWKQVERSCERRKFGCCCSALLSFIKKLVKSKNSPFIRWHHPTTHQ
jgi:hypothetical protein